ncbi:cystatin-A3-like [Ptychodera flava]|uniref:cystatin-A3-like n=1 Tax=Ptychodera flava TaxID=63121 RepID=UPI00396A560A
MEKQECPRFGDWSTPPEKPSPEVLELVNRVRTLVEIKLGVNFAEFEATLCRMQVVAGFNYLVKVFVGADRFIHVQFYNALDGSITLTAVEDHKKKEDPLNV